MLITVTFCITLISHGSAQLLFKNIVHLYMKEEPLYCFGFVDGTVRPLCRPGEHQRILYNGHKRVHAIKFQSVVTHNGLINNFYGPVERDMIVACLPNLVYYRSYNSLYIHRMWNQYVFMVIKPTHFEFTYKLHLEEIEHHCKKHLIQP